MKISYLSSAFCIYSSLYSLLYSSLYSSLPVELGNISCFIVLKNSLKINGSLLRRIMKKFGMKAMKNHGTLNGTLNDILNGTLKNDNLTDNELTLLSILLSNPSISLSDASDRMRIFRRTVSRIVVSLQDKGIVDRKESKKEGAGESSNRPF